MYKILFFLVFVFTVSTNFSQSADSILSLNNTQIFSGESYVFKTDLISKLPEKGIDNIIRFFPGIISYHNNYYLRGSRSNEIGFFVDGVQINDLFTWQNPFRLSPQSLDEINLYPGYVPVEYGNISSGMFGFKLKTGGEQLRFNIENTSDNISFSGDPFGEKERLGTFWYGYNEINANIGGPLFTNNIRFFVDANYLFKRDRNPQKYSGVNNFFAFDKVTNDSIRINLPNGIVPGNGLDNYNFTSTLLFDFGELKIKTSGIYSFQRQDAERLHIQEYLNHRYGQIENKAGLFSANITHNISENISYELTGSYFFRNEETFDPYLKDNYWGYGDSVANADAGIVWNRTARDFQRNYYGRYVIPRSYHVFDFSFIRDGAPPVNYAKSEQQKISLKGLAKLNFFDSHNIYLGGEYTSELIRLWKVGYQLSFARIFRNLSADPRNSSEESIKEMILKTYGVNNFGYDLLGNAANSGLFAPPEPTTFALFVNDNFTLADSLQLNIGLRYEYRDYNYRKIIDPLFPDKTFIRSFNNEIKEDGLTDTKSYSFILPKLNINYRLFNNLSFSLRYSGNVQSHNYNELFQGFFHQGYLLTYGRWNGNDPFLNGDLKPIETSLVEFSSDYNPADNISLRFNYFYKQIKNQSSLDYQKVDRNSAFYKYVIQTGESNSFVNGTDLMLEFLDKRFEIFSSLSYQNARGSFLTSHDNSYGDFIYTSAPTTSNNEINLKAFVSYNFFDLKKFSSLFENMNTSLMITFNNGHPYTLIKNYSRTESDIRDMKPIGEINGLTTPSITQIDFKLEKNISLFDKVNVGVYLMIINLFDSRNVYDVFRSSGSPDYDAHVSDPELYHIYVQSYGEKYLDLYKMNLEYNPRDGQQYFYGPPRQIYLGIKLNY